MENDRVITIDVHSKADGLGLFALFTNVVAEVELLFFSLFL